MRRSYRDVYPTGRKHCGTCGCWRHLFDFHVLRLNDDGEVLYLHSRCKPCRNVIRRQSLYPREVLSEKERHERKRRTKRRAYRNESPRQRRRRRDNELMHYYLRRERETGVMPTPRMKRVMPKDERKMSYLPVEPFRELLEPYHAMYGTQDLAEILAVEETQVRRWLGLGAKAEALTVQIDSVERILERLGRGLWEVYPELYG